jgi:hypothetical protein
MPTTKFTSGQSVMLGGDPDDIGTVLKHVIDLGPRLALIAAVHGRVYEVEFSEGGSGLFFADELVAP